MRLLFLTPQWPYPPRQGTAIRNWGLISHLARRHTVSVLTFGRAEDRPKQLVSICERVEAVAPPTRSLIQRVSDLALGRADLARRLWSPAFQAALEAWLQRDRFDGVQIEGLELAPYLATIRAHHLPVVYDAHNAEHVIQRRALTTDRGRSGRRLAALYSSIQLPRLRALERTTLRAVDGVCAVSAEDAEALRAVAPGSAPVIVPNGIDLQAYAPTAPIGTSPGRVVFTGKMDYRPNVDAVLWFVGEIWPHIRAGRPEASFWIVGQSPTTAVQALDGRDGVHVTGAVEDTRPYIAGAQVYVAPLRMGGGTRFKLLEAFALKRPVVSTRVGAEGFPVHTGREALLADTPLAFAEAVGSLLEDPALGERLAATGRALVAEHYDWAVIVPALESLWRALVDRP